MKKQVVFVSVFLITILLVSHFAFSATDTVPSPVPITKIKTTTYIYAGTLVASKSSDEPTKTQYYVQDHLGSNMKVFDGILEKQSNKYYAFGETTTTPPESDNPYQFTGKERDPETGLYYYSARYYKPELGRFIQADDLRGNLEDPLSLNRYAYVKNNPLKFVDPSGNRVVIHNSRDEGTINSILEDFKTKAGLKDGEIELKKTKDGLEIVLNVDKASYNGKYPETFAMLLEIVERPETILVKKVPLPVLEIKFRRGAQGKFQTREELDEEGVGLEGISGVAWYSKEDFPDIQGDEVTGVEIINLPPYIILAHELLGHGLDYLKGNKEIPEKPAYDAEDIVRDEHNFPTRKPDNRDFLKETRKENKEFYKEIYEDSSN